MVKNSLKIITIFMLLAVGTVADEFHGGGDILCSDCHTTHYSQSGTLPERAEPGGPFSDLLLIESADRLCLTCHDGTDPAAPDVLAPVAMYQGSGSEFSGGGFFSAAEGLISITGHDLGVITQVPYSNPVKATILSCISCHDPHGTINYRNLVIDPDSSGTGVTVGLGSDVFEEIHQQIPPSRNASIGAYRAGNIGYRARMTEWCADCHNILGQTDPANPPAHFNRHPSLASFEPSDYHNDPGHWAVGIGEGFGVATGDGIEGIPRLRFQAPGATDYTSATTPAASNQVFCGTCHFAHGGPFKSSILWPFNDQVSADLYSGCQQCHYK
ncbi:MAG: hypothetical protein A2W25_07690 [candidate division Zixibacteria bacterium RBG_16_53_22]|nr:MAG: hypothetical protein A2W25_07690 [candidate division Zixibacteria bacterium RBG_16_53_22]